MIHSRFGFLVLLGLLGVAPVAVADDARPAPRKPTVAPAAPPKANDRLELDPTSIRGNQELPKVLYIVPWKEPGGAEPSGRPLNSLINEALDPVDREVFRRQMNYFDQLYPAAGAGQAGGGTAPP